MKRFVVIMVTCASSKEAHAVSGALLKRKLVACANIITGVRSRFRWKGRIDSAKEVMLLLKARRSNFKKIEHVVRDVHSYEVPEIIAMPVISASKNYLDWIESET